MSADLVTSAASSQERRQEKCEDQVMHPDSNKPAREGLSGIIPVAASQPHVDAAGQQSGSTASICGYPSTKQPPQSHEEAHNYQQDPEDPDHRRYVRKQDRKRHHKNIFHLDTLKKCCRDDQDTDGVGTSYGTCFLAKMTLPADSAAHGWVDVNTCSDPPPPSGTATAPLYLLAAGHNLFCRKHGKYASEINLVSVSPGNIGKRKLLTEPLLNNKSDESYFKVPLLYQNADGNHDAELYDVGVICVPRRLFDDAALSSALLNVKDIALCVPHPSASKPRYRRGFVCGYPKLVWTPHNVDVNIPPEEYNDNCRTITDERTGVKMDQHEVTGALYEVPAEKSLKASSSSEFVDSKMERQSAGIFPFPQPENHFDQAGIKVKDVHYQITACEKTLLRHYIDTSYGQSGSPAYVDGDGEEREVIGIHVGVWYFTRDKDGKAKHNPRVDCNVLVQLNSTILAEVAELITLRPTPSHNETGEYHEAQPSPVPHPSAVLPYEDEEKSTWQSFRLRSNPAASGSRHGDIGVSSHASRVGETGLATGGVQGQMSGASADFPQSGQHGQLAVSTSSLPSSIAQPAIAVPADRSGDPWKFSECKKVFGWLVENMEPIVVRLYFNTLLNRHQKENLRSINYDKCAHNETILVYLEERSWQSFEMLVAFLAEQKGEEYAKRAQILKRAAGLL